jgi:hypothetical protein
MVAFPERTSNYTVTSAIANVGPQPLNRASGGQRQW